MAVSVVCVLNDDVLSTQEHTTVGPCLSRAISPVFLSPALTLSRSLIPFHFVSSLALTGISFRQKCNFVYVMGCLDKNVALLVETK